MSTTISTNGIFTIKAGKSETDIDWLCNMLSTSYWASSRTKQHILESLDNSLCLNVMKDQTQVGFGRVITDYTTFGYIADVIIDPAERGKGIGKWLLKCIVTYPKLSTCKLLLETKDAHGLYEQFGFIRKECMKKLP